MCNQAAAAAAIASHAHLHAIGKHGKHGTCKHTNCIMCYLEWQSGCCCMWIMLAAPDLFCMSAGGSVGVMMA